MFEFVEGYSSGTDFGSKYAPDLIETALITYIESKDVKVEVNAKKYKYKFILTSAEAGYD
jgi:hypothetical protein